MKILLKSSPANLLKINNLEDLQEATRQLESSLERNEDELRTHLKRLPREAVKAGVGNVVPSIINSKVAGIALTAGTALLGNSLIPKATSSTASFLGGTIKNGSIVTLGQMALKWLLRKKKK